MPIAPEEMIHTLRGPQPAHKLAAFGESVRILSWRGDRIGYAEAVIERLDVVPFCHRVVLDNGTSLIVSNTTRFLSRMGEEIPFEEVVTRLVREKNAIDKLGAITSLSVMPLYLGTNSRGYPIYRQLREDYPGAPASIDRRRMRPIARMVYEQKIGGYRIPAGMYVRHEDGNPHNCEPENLRLEGKQKSKPNQTKTHRHIAAQKMISPNNHKIVGIQHWGEEEVYEVHVIGASNFAVGEVFLMAAADGT